MLKSAIVLAGQAISELFHSGPHILKPQYFPDLLEFNRLDTDNSGANLTLIILGNQSAFL